MCLLSFSWQPGTETPLTLVSNRDEFHKRPTAPAAFWQEYPDMLAGKDLEAGGTWLGITRAGRFAALTNVRQLPSPYQGTISRGHLVKDFLTSNASPRAYLDRITGADYDGFNLIVGDRDECWYLGNRPLSSVPQKLSAGTYGLSNAQLNSPWPKTLHAQSTLKNWLSIDASNQPPLHQLLNSQEKFPSHLLPQTGIGEPWETLLSAPFIVSPEYGTRACTSIQILRSHTLWTEATISVNGIEESIAKYSF